MSISLPTNKEEKRQRYDMLVKQGSISQVIANRLYREYCQRMFYDCRELTGKLFGKVKK